MIYWAAWLLLGFGIPETIALVSHHPENTLSEVVWRWFDVLPGQTLWQWKFVHFILLAFLVWLAGHLAFRIWR